MRNLSSWCCLLFLAVGARGAIAGEEDPAARLQGDLHRLRGVHDRLLTDLSARAAADLAAGGTVDLRLHLAAFMEMNRQRPADQPPADLEILLPQRGGVWLPGRGATPRWTRGDHAMVADGLILDQQGLRGTCTVTMDPSGFPDVYGKPLNYSSRPEDRTPLVFAVTLDLTRTGDRLAGSYHRAAAHGYPTVTAPVTATIMVPAPPSAPPAADLPAAAAGDLYHAIRILDRMRLRHCGADRAVLPEEALAPVAPEGVPAATLAAYVSALADAAVAWEAAGRPTTTCPTGPLPSSDADFGPWYGDGFLPCADGRNLLPADAGGAGPQRWAAIGGWRVLGPLPGGIDLREPESHLPPWPLPATAATAGGPARRQAVWRDLAPAAGLQLVSGPNGSPVADHGHGRWLRPDLPVGKDATTGFLATATVTAPAAVTLWLGTAIKSHGTPTRLWVNERLVWQSERVDRPGDIGTAVVAVPFRAGDNRVVLRADASSYEGSIQPFFVSLCLRGAPRAAPEAALARERQIAAIDAAEKARAGISGYLGNFHGTAPSARPPLAWDLDRGHNVRWQVELPETAAGNAVVIGDRLLTSGEPHYLYCLDRETGAIRWRTTSSIFELAAPDRLAESEAALAAATAATRTLERGNRLRQQAKEDPAAAAELAALADELAAAKAVVRRWELLARTVGWGEFPWWHQSSWATPVSDGESVWVKFGTGVVACYDLAGTRRWMIATGAPRTGTRPSPLLVDGRLICLLPRRGGTGKGWSVEVAGDDRNFELVAYAAADGRELWATPVRAMANEGQPVVLHPSDGTTVLPVICTPCGTVVRADDGRVLIDYTGMFATEWQIPAWDRDQLIYPMPFGSTSAGRLHLLDRDTVGFEPLWRSLNQGFSTIQSHGQYMLTAGGHCYHMACRRATGQELSWQEGVAINATTGEETGRILPVFAQGDKTYAPHAAAGGFIFLLNSLNVAVCTGGPEPYVLARSRIPDTYSAPVFADDRMYLRHQRGLLCVGPTGAEGRRYELETIATEAFFAIGAPPTATPAAVATRGPVTANPTVPWRVARATAPARWLFAGPFPRAAVPDADAADALALRLRPVAGEELALGDTRRAFAPLDPAWITAKQNHVWYRGRYGYTEQLVIDVLGPVGGAGETVAYYHSELVADRDQVVTVSTGGASYSRSWLDGTPTEEDRLYRLPTGRHHWLIEVRFGRIPRIGQLVMRPVIMEQPDPAMEQAAWCDRIRIRRGELERLVAELPGSPVTAQATLLLHSLASPTATGAP